MPKQKTSSQAKKRFKLTARGMLLRRRAGQSHNLESTTPKLKRSFNKDVPLAPANRRTVARMLGKGRRG